MNEAEELFDELMQYHRAQFTTKQRYSRLYNLLDRMCKDLTQDYAAEYTSLFARLCALCAQKHYPQRASIELFRINAVHVRKGESAADDKDYHYDLKALCDFISFFYQTPVPEGIRKLLPNHWRAFPQQPPKKSTLKRVRFVVDSWDEDRICGHAEDYPTKTKQQVNYHIGTDIFKDLPQQLYGGEQVNLLDTSVEENNEGVVFHPSIIVLEPDYLIDVTALTECVETYGATAYNYLVKKFIPNPSTRHILLGNAANQFLDDLVNENESQPITWEESITLNFRDFLLDYCICPDVDDTFFQDTKEQFKNIRQTIAERFQTATVDINRSNALLEPSFFCECLGLQGRIDLMLNDFSRIIELKSGKCEEFNGPPRGKMQHSLQMTLYKEILHYNMDQSRDNVHTFLFYSRYPHLFEQQSSKMQIQSIIALRNAIVAQERRIRYGEGLAMLQSLTPEILNVKHCNNKLWKEYQEPRLKDFLRTFRQCTQLETAYFNRFLQFMQQEQFLGKIGDDQPDSGRGFSETWNADVETKLANGNILMDLQIDHFEENRGIERLFVNLPTFDEDFLANFREGDYVIFYERNSEEDLATNHIAHRCIIEKITYRTLTLKLVHKQRNPIVFHQQSLYAVEHDYLDATNKTIYQGLYSFLNAPKERRDLLLCQRDPKINLNRTLNGTCSNPAISNLVLQAKQADDYYLLVGPPGTGKTSVALKAMVQEFYSEPSYQILLLSYTNRAVDEICKMLASIVPQPIYIRIGSELNCEESYRSNLMKNKVKECRTRKQILDLFNRHRIIVGTVASISGQLNALSQLKRFDVAIIDEASQILEPHLLSILSAKTKQGDCAIRKFIMIGDHKQLPAVVIQRQTHSQVDDERLQSIGLTDCRNSLFERLYSCQLTHPTSNISSTLLKQGRMHPDVCEFVNRNFYHGDLQTVPVPHQLQPLDFPNHGRDLQEYIATRRVGFLHCDYPETMEVSNKHNRKEARIVASIVGTINELCLMNGFEFNPAERIGIIVPFRGQISMIRKEIEKLQIESANQIVVDTVERFQGSQRDIIIFSTTISQPYQLNILSAPVEIEGQMVDRKLNVALTRAKKQLFVVGNANLLSRHPLYKALIDAFSR